jgi:hypothetical protein
MWAARDGDLTSVQILLAAGADTRPANLQGRDAFLLAAEGGKPETIEMFILAVAREERLAILKDHHVPAGVNLRIVAQLARLCAPFALKAPDFLAGRSLPRNPVLLRSGEYHGASSAIG